MGILNNLVDNLTFKDAIFLKKNSDLNKKYDALKKLLEENPNNEKINEELYIVKKGFEGEKEIEYQLSKSNLGLYVLHDINIEYEDLKAQIDYIIISRCCCYFVECKNLIGNITVNDKGEFIREYTYNGKKTKKGMYSPIRQVEAQRDVYKKIWYSQVSSFKKIIVGDNFYNTYRTLVVAANPETILNTKYAPKDIKYRVIKADGLVRKIQYDLDHSDKELWDSKKSMEEWCRSFLLLNVDKKIDYYNYYKEKFQNNTEINTSPKICPQCGGKLVIRAGKYGKFWGCSNYPNCKFTLKIN